MLWTPSQKFQQFPFEGEKQLEAAIQTVKADLFGKGRIYLETKRLIGRRGIQQNIPDAYVLDLSSAKVPKLFVVENEMASHDHLKHIAVQILQFSLAFEINPHLVKQVLRDTLKQNPDAESVVASYAKKNGFENIDFLLENVVHRKEAFNALLIIDESAPELENVLQTKFQFPVEILTLQRFKADNGAIIYNFEPLLGDVDSSDLGSALPPLDPSELDTVIVPAQADGFEQTAIAENRWYAIRMSAPMIPQIKFLATYRVNPVSAVTHWAPVAKIQSWKDSGKYEVVFAEPLKEFKKGVCLVPKSKVKAPQAPRYTSFARLKVAKNLDQAF